MKTEMMNIRIEFTEPVLGMASGNQELHTKHIAAKAPTVTKAKEETESVLEKPEDFDLDEALYKASTVFPRDAQGLHLWDYQLRGFFKEQILILIELGDESVKGLSKWQYKKAVDNLLYVHPRKIYLHDLAGRIWQAAPTSLQRPLRAETMRGERIALANSEQLPVGTSMEFTVEVLSGSNAKSKLAVLSRETVTSALDFGSRKGFGQWRSGGFGRFNWKEVSDLGQQAA